MEELHGMTEERLIELCINKNLYDIWHAEWEAKNNSPCTIHMAALELSSRINKLKSENKRLLNLFGRYIPLAMIVDDDVKWAMKSLGKEYEDTLYENFSELYENRKDK